MPRCEAHSHDGLSGWTTAWPGVSRLAALLMPSSCVLLHRTVDMPGDKLTRCDTLPLSHILFMLARSPPASTRLPWTPDAVMRMRTRKVQRLCACRSDQILSCHMELAPAPRVRPFNPEAGEFHLSISRVETCKLDSVHAPHHLHSRLAFATYDAPPLHYCTLCTCAARSGIVTVRYANAVYCAASFRL
jgi:hypothetical protein